MKKNIWILNHYATDTFFDKGGRHFWFAENLIKDGYNATIFCANTVHNTNKIVDIDDDKLYKENMTNNISYVFIKTSGYSGNESSRVKNMVKFYINMYKVGKIFNKKNKKPDIIYASSVHPLTLLVGLKLARKYKIPCICEVRDLWPLTLVELDKIEPNALFTKLLYMGEHWIYKKADSLIFTMEGGKDYIIDKGWNKNVNIDNVYHINNGVDLKEYYYNLNEFILDDEDLNDEKSFKIIYTGAIRKFNSIENVINVAKLFSNSAKYNNIKFLIYGDGTDKESLIEKCKIEKIDNVIFKGTVGKKYIPYILSKSNLNLLFYNDKVNVFRYGSSQNKLFEYLASGKPIITNIDMNYSVLKKFDCEIAVNSKNAEDVMHSIIDVINMNETDLAKYSENSKKGAEAYDFKYLTKQLENVIESTVNKK